MNKYIVSLVLVMVMPLLEKNGEPRLSIQNVVGITEADSEKEAFQRVAKIAKAKHPGHNIQLFNIIDMEFTEPYEIS